ncbi:hypothetical protein [Algoriphagus antarcticus]|uniref:Uncharacterized protein n=1 Tax=Algoriphagus antarcticus TaxID=238540 RepID=A0A3E0DG72_9BACT|nr:hypothetical protein [Algoriphagus antarcticus]REG81553.1 hypothetical protein C8N25_12657 [Algoriphagus antarcticus]
MKELIIVLGIIALFYFTATQIVPLYIEAPRNLVKSPQPYSVSKEAETVYDRVNFISDLHWDALLWEKNLTLTGSREQVSFLRGCQANVALEILAIVPQSLSGHNMQGKSSDAFNNIATPSIAKAESLANWFRPINRTLAGSEKLADFTELEIKAIMGGNLKRFFLQNHL